MCGRVQHGAVGCGAVWCSVVRCGAVRCGALCALLCAVRCAVLYGAVRCCHVLHCDAMMLHCEFYRVILCWTSCASSTRFFIPEARSSAKRYTCSVLFLPLFLLLMRSFNLEKGKHRLPINNTV